MHTMNTSKTGRRQFIKAASGVFVLGAVSHVLPGRLLAKSPDAICEMFCDSLDETALRTIARQAMEAAAAAGAQYADVRVNSGRGLVVSTNEGIMISVDNTVGIRAVVKGSWGFAAGHDLAPDQIADLARLAVRRARAADAATTFEFAPAPVVRDGRWETPIEIDPFTIPPKEQFARVTAAHTAARDIKGLRNPPSARLSWGRSHRIFASTEGSVIVQRTYDAAPRFSALASPGKDFTVYIEVEAGQELRGSVGYESVASVNLDNLLGKACQDAVRLAASPFRSVDVGRYDLVVNSRVMAALVAETIGSALELDRALGEKANGIGTSYAMPPMKILGEYRLGSPLLTITADRSRPRAGGTVGWDDEGVAPDEFTLVKDGRVVDYITTRPTAPAIAAWYESRGLKLGSHGCAYGTGIRAPELHIPNLTVQPGTGGADIESLVKGVKKGFYVEDARGSLDQQCLNGQYRVLRGYEIVNGKRGALASDMAFQFSTPQLWKSLTALGGPSSAVLEHVWFRALTGHTGQVGLQAVPGHFRQVNVLNTGKQA